MLKILKNKYLKKTLLFLGGSFTVPSITGGWVYDLFGTSDWREILGKILHPSMWLDAFTVYTIAFLTFGYLPEKISKRHWFVKFFYFLIYYLILLKISHLFIGEVSEK
ncbi:MAG: hypothetical protein Q4D11_06170 [Rhodospirillales bacterium]|nr:hypothetical protein [Rhodospirillales bacterium]